MFDNVTEEGYKAVMTLLPQGISRGDILFTSQRPGAMDKLTGNLKTRCLRLEGLSSKDCVDLFHMAASVVRTADTVNDAGDIVKSNGYLPQAVQQAASYIKNTDISLPDYKRQFESNAYKVRYPIPVSILQPGVNLQSYWSTKMRGIVVKRYQSTCRSV